MFGLIAVVAVLIPVAQSLADSRTQQLALQRTAALDQVVQRARTALVQGDADGLQAYLQRFHAVYGESVLVLDEGGDAVASAGEVSRDERVDALVTAASGPSPSSRSPASPPGDRTPPSSPCR